ncbi:phytanoyl-CoA dioxygenase, peroxisomal-like [Oncorhynchus tshawytscha]|uniref:phytanoyl-CoA dioxygenase n=1 Tax=Oncorhynchus tshawytscha TaxID=74940 RepID=A0A8C8FRI3_ONCTS|nr:phytanoyl-CoA dioxygenase, peroxisomal-like [Oncorhynchus tshawytscha]
MSGAADRLKVVVNHLDRPSSFVQASTSGKNVAYYQPQALRYSFDNDLLSTEQRISYEEDGFLLIKGLVSGEHIDRFRAAFERIFRREVQVPGLVVMRDMSIAKSEFIPDQKTISKLQDFQEEPELFRYCSLEPAQVIRDLVTPCTRTCIIFHSVRRTVLCGPGPPWRRFTPWWSFLVLTMAPSKNTTTQSGRVNKMYHGVRDYDPNHPRVHLEMEKGDTVFFHPLLIHGSEMNQKQGFRKAISCHYAGANCYSIDVRGTTQENIGKEVYEITASKYAVDDATFEDTWAVRGRLVQGDRTNL